MDLLAELTQRLRWIRRSSDSNEFWIDDNCTSDFQYEGSFLTRIQKILRSTLTRESNRLDLGLARAILVLVVFVSFFVMPYTASSPNVIGKSLLTAFFPISIILNVILAGRLTRDRVGDNAGGFTSLLALTGTSRMEWIAVRLTQIWIGFLLVWIIRIPFVLLIFTLGGVLWEDLIAMESLLLMLFMATSTAALLAAHSADNQKSAGSAGWTALVRAEFLLLAGNLFLHLLGYAGISAPTQIADVCETLASASLYQRLVRYAGSPALGTSVMSQLLVINAVLYLLIAVYSLVRFHRDLYSSIGESPQPQILSKKEQKETQKARRQRLARCWDDALAWQSYVFYSGGSDHLTGRVVLYCLALLLILGSYVTSMLEPFSVLLMMVGAVALINAVNTPAKCMEKETKAKTLTALILTPYTGRELYKGWRRGASYLLIPDLVFAAMISAGMYFVEPMGSLVIVTVTLAILMNGPFFMLSHLVPLKWNSLATGMFVIIGFIGVVVVGLIAGGTLFPIAAPLVMLPLWWLFNQLLLRVFLEKWIGIRVDSLE